MTKALVCVVLVGLMGWVGCESKGGGANISRSKSGSGAAGNSDVWCPKPVAMRIYPSTRLVYRNGSTILQARIELLDDMSDSVKSSGQIFFELYGISGGGGVATPKSLYSWSVAVRTRDDQLSFYEPVVRAYLFRLSLSEPWPPKRQAKLRVLFTPNQGRRLETSSVLVGKPIRVNKTSIPIFDVPPS